MQTINAARILENSGLLRYADPGDYKKIVEDLNIHTMKYVNKQVIFRQNEKVDYLAIVIDGTVTGRKIHGIGDVDMVHVYKDGEIFAHEGIMCSGKKSPLDYISDGVSEILFVEVKSVWESRFAQELMHGIAGCLADDSVQKTYRMEAVSKKKIREKVITFLKIRISETGSNSVILNMTREELARELCVNRSALSKELSEMQRDGLIRISRDKITLL